MPKAAKPQPTLWYLLNLRREMEAVYQLDDQQIDIMRQLRTQTRPVALEESARMTDVEVRDSVIGDEIQRVAATLSLNDPKLTVTPAREGDAGEMNASLREKWTLGVLTEAGHSPHGDTLALVVDAVVGDGGAWTKLLFRKDAWDERYALRPAGQDAASLAVFDQQTEEAKKGAGVPFSWVAVDVRTAYPLWGGGKLMGMLEVTRRPKNEVFREFRMSEMPDGTFTAGIAPEDLGPPSGAVNVADGTTNRSTVRDLVFYEYWDDTWVVYAVEAYTGEPVNAQAGSPYAPAGQQKIVQAFKHGYGRVPYFFAPGLTYSWQQGRKVGSGIAQSKRYLCELQAYLQTLHAQVALRDFQMPVGRQLADGAAPLVGEDGSPAVEKRYGRGTLVPMQAGETWVKLPVPDVSPALLQHIAMVDKQIEQMLTPRITAEIGSGQEGAGFAINQLLAEVRVQQDPLAKHVAAMLKEITLFLWWLVRNKVRETVYVQGSGPGGWLGAGPDDLTATVGVSWKLNPDRPTAALIDHRDLHERMQNKTLGRHEAILRMDDNPDEVDDDIALDEIRALPQYKLMQYQDLFERLDRGDAFKMAAALAVATGALPGGPPAGEQPAMGSGSVPDMGALAAAPGGGGMAPQPAPLQSLGGAAPPATQQPGALGG